MWSYLRFSYNYHARMHSMLKVQLAGFELLSISVSSWEEIFTELYNGFTRRYGSSSLPPDWAGPAWRKNAFLAENGKWLDMLVSQVEIVSRCKYLAQQFDRIGAQVQYNNENLICKISAIEIPL